MLNLKRLFSLLLVIALLLSSTSVLFVNAQETETELPSSVDNSESPYFPETLGDADVLDNEALDPSLFAVARYQFTYTMNKARGVETTFKNTFSPRFLSGMLYNYMHSGVNVDKNLEVMKVLMNYGCATNATLPYERFDAPDNQEWSTLEKVYREAVKYRVASYTDYAQIGEKDTLITSPDDADLVAIKTALSNGEVLSCTAHQKYYYTKTIASSDNAPANADYAGETILYAALDNGQFNGNEYNTDAFAIVGYNDDIWYDINQNGTVDDGEMGALKVATANTYEGGFMWIAYDALNRVSVVDGAYDVASYNTEYRCPAITYVRGMEVELPYEENDIYVRFSVLTYTEFDAYFTATDKDGNVYKGQFLEDVNYTARTNTSYLNTSEFVYPLRFLVPGLNNENFDDYNFTITIKNTAYDNRHTRVSHIDLVNEYDKTESPINDYFIGNDKITLLDGEEYTAEIKNNTFIFYAGFDNPTVYYRTSESDDFVALPMAYYEKKYYPGENDYKNFVGFLYKAYLDDITEAQIYFADENGNVDDNNGEYYTATTGENFYFTDGIHEPLTFHSFDFANGLPDLMYVISNTEIITKNCTYVADVTGGYEPYEFNRVLENVETGEVSETGYTELENISMWATDAGTYTETMYVKDFRGTVLSLSREVVVEDRPFQIVSITADVDTFLVGQPIVFTAITDFENFYPNGGSKTKANNFFYTIYDSEGNMVWSETKYSDSFDRLSKTSTNTIEYTPTKAGEYTLKIWGRDYLKEVTETKTLSFTVCDSKIGDANTDGALSIIDATIIQFYLASLITENEFSMSFSDCDGDSNLSILDVTNLQRYLAKFDNCGKTGETYVYTPKTYTVNFINVFGWTDITCYYHSKNPQLTNPWPGALMTKIGVNQDGHEVYSIQLPDHLVKFGFTNCDYETDEIFFTGDNLTYRPLSEDYWCKVEIVDLVLQ
ncbi:MAG: dockerin type I repeat-containing protein [Ruminococcus sp.]|nr:dockerin type I repeat-containing protein [Ruminococcus sp.]